MMKVRDRKYRFEKKKIEVKMNSKTAAHCVTQIHKNKTNKIKTPTLETFSMVS